MKARWVLTSEAQGGLCWGVLTWKTVGQVLCPACDQSRQQQPPKEVSVWIVDTDQNRADFKDTQTWVCILALSFTSPVTLH